MIWAALILLGIPIWLVLGILGGGLWNRRRFQQRPGVFPIRTRELSSEKKWSRKMHAVWIHDVLLCSEGLALVRTAPYGVQSVSREVAPLDSSEVKGFGDDPISFVLIDDDGTEIEFATDREHADLATGPFATQRNLSP